MKEKKKIKVCNYCQNPIFWTFIFAGAEYYCPSCGASADMFFGRDVPATKKLLKLKKSLAIKFGQVKKYLFTGGAKKDGCEKCKNEYHIRHLSLEEKTKHDWAIKRLKELKTK